MQKDVYLYGLSTRIIQYFSKINWFSVLSFFLKNWVFHPCRHVENIEQNLFEFLLNLLLNLLLGATIDPPWAKKYLNLNTLDFFLQVHPKTAQKRGFYGPKMAKNGTVTFSLIR